MRTDSPSRWASQALLVVALATGGVGACATKGASSDLVVQVPDTDRDAEVFVDGNYVGQVEAISDPGKRIKLAPGPHRVEVRKPGRFPVQRTVEVGRTSGPETVLEAELLEDPE